MLDIIEPLPSRRGRGLGAILQSSYVRALSFGFHLLSLASLLADCD